ncbi:peptidoglycan-binding domain-containing protein [Streptomyces sp. SLBN-115]|uniref:peptidoglycan-binding domain-containing protein n=2 Tax=Streptomyces TaxID=1883 RepID=UPI00114E8106|nr:peptidoglycan-binding domain-containing protein [Streptomyces sp. SLBN-115]TQJ57457.1 putative peptidoglycan binding protein [Streptomyces sp. SLBN-115]
MPTPDEPGKPHERPVLEPIRVLRPRNTDALAELFREMAELTQDPDAYEAIPLRPEAAGDDAKTEELPPLDHLRTATTATATRLTTPTPRGGRDWASEHGGPRPLPGGDGPGGRRSAARERSGSRAVPATEGARARTRTGSGAGVRRGAITVGVCAAALVGFACALLLPGRGGEAAAQTPPPTAATPAPAATAAESADPDGAGTLREGDSGAEVADLQQRLLRIPDVYANGPTDGRYGTVLTEAVARFQLWYGIRGDESGVYGDDTRRDLESRTASAGG